MQTKLQFLALLFKSLLTFTQTSVVCVTKTTFLLMYVSCHLSVRWYNILLYIIIIRHDLCLNRPISTSPTVSSKVFKVVFDHFFYNSTLLLISCCCLFLLYVVAFLTCIFLVSRQLFYFLTLPKCLNSFLWSKRDDPALLLKYFISINVSRFYPSF
jgi:hypothetical protein